MDLLSVNECSKLMMMPGRTITSWIVQGHLKAARSPSKKKKRYFVRRNDLISLAVKMNLPDAADRIKKGTKVA